MSRLPSKSDVAHDKAAIVSLSYADPVSRPKPNRWPLRFGIAAVVTIFLTLGSMVLALATTEICGHSAYPSLEPLAEVIFFPLRMVPPDIVDQNPIAAILINSALWSILCALLPDGLRIARNLLRG